MRDLCVLSIESVDKPEIFHMDPMTSHEMNYCVNTVHSR